MVDLMFLAPLGSILALAFAGYLAWFVMKNSEGSPAMVGSVVALAALALALGFFIAWPAKLAEMIRGVI